MLRIARLQVKCREPAKQVDTMLLREMRQARAQAPPGSAQQQLDADIRCWVDIGARLRQIGTDEVDSHQILMLDRQIPRDTGGCGAEQVGQDQISEVGARWTLSRTSCSPRRRIDAGSSRA